MTPARISPWGASRFLVACSRRPPKGGMALLPYSRHLRGAPAQRVAPAMAFAASGRGHRLYRGCRGSMCVAWGALVLALPAAWFWQKSVLPRGTCGALVAGAGAAGATARSGKAGADAGSRQVVAQTLSVWQAGARPSSLAMTALDSPTHFSTTQRVRPSAQPAPSRDRKEGAARAEGRRGRVCALSYASGRPRVLNLPEAQPLPAVGDESPVGAPPLFPLGGEDVGLRQLKHSHPVSWGARTSPHLFPLPGNSGCHPPLTTPRCSGLSRWATPPPVHPYPPPRPQQPVVHPLQQKPESPNRTLRGDESRFEGWGSARTAGSHGKPWRALHHSSTP